MTVVFSWVELRAQQGDKCDHNTINLCRRISWKNQIIQPPGKQNLLLGNKNLFNSRKNMKTTFACALGVLVAFASVEARVIRKPYAFVSTTATTATKPARFIVAETDSKKSTLTSVSRAPLPKYAVSGPDHHYDPDHNKSLLEKGIKKLSNILPWVTTTEKETLWAKRERLRQRKAIGKEMKQLLRPFPFPFRTMGNTVVSGVDRAVRTEGRKIEKYLMKSQKLLNSDECVVQLLGKPVVVGSVFSQNSWTESINGRKTVHIQASFEVVGSSKNAVATMIANKKEMMSLELKSATGLFHKVDIGENGKIGAW